MQQFPEKRDAADDEVPRLSLGSIPRMVPIVPNSHHIDIVAGGDRSPMRPCIVPNSRVRVGRMRSEATFGGGRRRPFLAGAGRGFALRA